MSLIYGAEDWFSLQPIPDSTVNMHTQPPTHRYTHTGPQAPLENKRDCGKEDEGGPQIPLDTKPGKALAQDCQEKKVCATQSL